jgi:hypothetical protein
MGARRARVIIIEAGIIQEEANSVTKIQRAAGAGRFM